MRRPHRSQGFTLLEMALVVGIGGLIMAAIASGYRVYLQGQQMRDVNIRLVAINQALNAFAGSSTGNRFPCPADPSIPMTALNAGQEVCSASGAVVQITGAKDAGRRRPEHHPDRRRAFRGPQPLSRPVERFLL